ncbi:hypothetical protein Poli38472_002258 [Pythium oligandrum]|uniref:Sodium-dependent phosphate transporter n=1 Tax=Pythium oligandrum TaxID=41045 RepID=A0A8K1FKZ2_PYTOL|nr:hypothetical protein Poli38472_002258 [Pythium oligandrum]|eukprot:TMW63317.1 hypothetical protein Poli38472_002258 [Pythium oligandrum]
MKAMAAGSASRSRSSTEEGDTDQFALTMSPIQFILTYENLQEAAEEEAYEHQTTRRKVVSGVFYAVLAIAALYFLIIGIKFIGDGFTLVLSCGAQSIFDFTDNPVAALSIGTITTAIIHSSSTVTSVTVAAVGAGGMSMRQGAYIIMGANIGTCVTCMMVAFGQISDRRRFQRAMGAAAVHDIYNIVSVVIMFPLEVIAHPLEKLSMTMANWKSSRGAFTSPIDFVVNPLAALVVKVDKKRFNTVAAGKEECHPDISLVIGGAFEHASMDDRSIGAIVLSIGILFLIVALMALSRMLSRVFLGSTKRAVFKVLDYNGYLNIFLGTAITFGVHSSTVVTSLLTPLAGLGVVTLEQVYPLVIGANLGTTATALLVSLVTESDDAVAIALVHFWFNVFGIVLFYPIPITRMVVLKPAKSFADASAAWPAAAVIYMIAFFLIIPGIFLGLATMCTSSNSALVINGYVSVTSVIVGLALFLTWYYCYGGRRRWHQTLEQKRVDHEIRKYGGNIGMPSFVDDETSIYELSDRHQQV